MYLSITWILATFAYCDAQLWRDLTSHYHHQPRQQFYYGGHDMNHHRPRVLTSFANSVPTNNMNSVHSSGNNFNSHKDPNVQPNTNTYKAKWRPSGISVPRNFTTGAVHNTPQVTDPFIPNQNNFKPTQNQNGFGYSNNLLHNTNKHNQHHKPHIPMQHGQSKANVGQSQNRFGQSQSDFRHHHQNKHGHHHKQTNQMHPVRSQFNPGQSPNSFGQSRSNVRQSQTSARPHHQNHIPNRHGQHYRPQHHMPQSQSPTNFVHSQNKFGQSHDRHGQSHTGARHHHQNHFSHSKMSGPKHHSTYSQSTDPFALPGQSPSGYMGGAHGYRGGPSGYGGGAHGYGGGASGYGGGANGYSGGAAEYLGGAMSPMSQHHPHSRNTNHQTPRIRAHIQQLATHMGHWTYYKAHGCIDPSAVLMGRKKSMADTAMMRGCSSLLASDTCKMAGSAGGGPGGVMGMMMQPSTKRLMERCISPAAMLQGMSSMMMLNIESGIQPPQGAAQQGSPPSDCSGVTNMIMMSAPVEGGMFSPEAMEHIGLMRAKYLPMQCVEQMIFGSMPLRMCCPGHVRPPSKMDLMLMKGMGSGA